MGLFDRFQYVPGQAKDHFVRNGAIVFAVFGLIVYFMYSGGRIPFVGQSGRIVTADFVTSANVSPGKTPVRVHGVNVGEVSSLKRLPGGRGVEITMRITDKGVHLRNDARAHIYWRTLLGFAFYIQLDEGSDPQPLSGTIPMSRTDSQVELDQVLQGITPPARSGIQQIFDEFNKGFNQNSQSGRSLDALGPAMQQIGPGLEAIRGEAPGDLTNTVRNTSVLMGELARNETDLGNLISNGDTALGVTAARRADIGNILNDGPATLDQTKETVIRLRKTLGDLDPIADKLRPGVREIVPMSHALKPALAQLNPALDDARPTLKDLQPAIKKLRGASRAGVPFLQSIEPTLDNLNNTILPGLDVKGQTGRKAYEVIGPTIAAVSDSATLYDVNGFVQRFNAVSGGSKSAGAIPCSVDVNKGLSCNDLNSVIGTLVGTNPGTGIGSAANPPGNPNARSGSSTSSSPAVGSGSSSSSSAGTGGTSSAADSTPADSGTVKQVTDYVQGVL